MKRKYLNFGFTGIYENVKTKGANNVETLVIEGFANTVDRDRMGDVIMPEAFKAVIERFQKNPILLYMHNWERPVGRVTDIDIRENGLFVRAIISNASDVEDIRTKIKEGILRTFSIGYDELESEYKDDTKYVTAIDLYEISIVTVPANFNAVFEVSEKANEGGEVSEKTNHEGDIKTSEKDKNKENTEETMDEKKKQEKNQKTETKETEKESYGYPEVSDDIKMLKEKLDALEEKVLAIEERLAKLEESSQKSADESEKELDEELDKTISELENI